jgi:hypothetical protein
VADSILQFNDDSTKNVSDRIRLMKEAVKIARQQETLTDAELAKLRQIEALEVKLLNYQKKKLENARTYDKKQLSMVASSAGELANLESISDIYRNLTSAQSLSLRMGTLSLKSSLAAENADASKYQLVEGILGETAKLNNLQQKLAETGPEDVEAQKSIRAQYDAQVDSIRQRVAEARASGDLTADQVTHFDKILERQQKSLGIAEQYATVSSKSKEIVQGQIDAYKAVEKTIRGIIGTAQILFSSWRGFAGGTLIAAGMAAEKLGATVRAMGGYMGGVTFSTTALGLVFKDAQGVAEGLNAELGGMSDVTFQTQLNTNLMATNMGISGQEAASLTGNFARLNGNSTSIAADMAESTRQLAKSKGVMPSAVMKDVAKSSKAFAEYGKDGGKNIAEAAVAAARLGVNMDSLTKVADHLLDFESSITDELELGAMLGRNINLNNARDLAYRGQIGAAVKDALHQLGGIDAYNKMDVFQKRQAAKALGLSTEELDKMVKNQDKLNDDGTLQLSTFESWSQSLTAFATGPLGSVLKTMGGLVLSGAQFGGALAQMGFNIGGMVKGTFQMLGNFAKMAVTKVAGMFGKKISFGAGKGPELPDTNKIADGSDKMSKGKGGIGDKLKDLAKGLKEMGSGKVLFGALNLIPTGLGFLGMIPGLPTLWLLSKMDVSGVGKGLGELAKGLKKMGDGKVLFGALSLSLAGLAFTVMTLGVIGMAAVALLGIPTGVALTALGKGFKSFGDNALKGVLVFGLLAGVIGLSALAFQQFAGVDWTSVIFGGIALAAFALGAFAISKVANDIIKGSIAIAILGIALIPFTYAMSLLAGLSMESVAAAAVGLVLFAGAVFALGAIMFSGVGALVFGAGILALIALGGALMILGVGISVLAGGMTALNGVLGPIATSISTIMTSLGGILGMIGPIALLSMALFGLGASMIFLGSAGLIALPGITALAAIQTITVGLASILGLDAGGAGKDGKDAKMDELINEIKGLRADMNAGKIQVHMDGQKVTSSVSKVVDRLTGNSYKQA